MELLTFVLIIIIAILLFFLLQKKTDIVRYQDIYGCVK